MLGAVKARIPKGARRAYNEARTRAKGFFRAFGFFKIARRKVRGTVIRIAVSSNLEQYRADSYATKEPETLDWLDQNLRDGDVLFDVGANIGLYALYGAKIRPGCTVYAFEPEAQNFSRLCGNIRLNALGNVVPCNFPLSDKDAFGLLHVTESQAGSALNSFGRPSDFHPSPAAPTFKQGALSTNLDTLIEKRGLPAPTLMKIDVDGLEDDILRGAANLLRSGKLRGLLVELNLPDGAKPSPAIRDLEACGYTLVRKGDSVWECAGIKSQNLIFALAR